MHLRFWNSYRSYFYFDEFLDIMRFEECSTYDDFSHLLRDVTLLGDSPESTDGEDEEVVEVL